MGGGGGDTEVSCAGCTIHCSRLSSPLAGRGRHDAQGEGEVMCDAV